MKKKITLLVFLLFLFSRTNAQTFKWAVQIGGSDYDSGEDIAFDADGNSYLVGIFNSTADFDPGAGTYNLTSAGAQDVYIVKLDSNKNFIWAARAGPHQDFAYSIAVNGSSLYVCGNFRDTADFDPGAGINNLISAGGSDIFILKLDTASNFISVSQVGNTGDDVAEKLTIDNTGNILVCGQFQATVDFDPGAGVQNMISNGSADAYVLKLDADGNYIWAGHYGNNPGQFAYGIAADASGDVYVTGGFYGTTDFDPGVGVYNLTASGFNSNIYVLKWSSAGVFTWADNMGNSSGGNWGASIKTDGAGNPVISGTYFGTVDFDPGLSGTFNLTAAGNNGDIFVVKLTSSTGAFMFAKGMGGTGLDQPYGLALNVAGAIYVTGLFSLTADFDPDAPVFNLTASGPSDAFIVELDAAGNFLWAFGFGGTDSDFGRGINTYGSDVLATGVFAFMPDFDPGLPVYNLSSFSNSSDAYLLKLSFCTPVQNSVSYNLCPGDSVFAGGVYQYTPGLFYDYYTAASGCDSIVTTTVQYTFNLNLGNDIISCDGQSVLLDAATSPGALYLWNTGVTTSSILVTGNGTYWVSVTFNGCVRQDTVVVTFQPLPIVNLGMDTAICTTSSITLDAGTGFTSYLWTDGSTLQTFTLYGSSGAGIYYTDVLVTDSFGCFNTDTIIITVNVCTGINDPSSSPGFKFSVHPNPAGDFIFIEAAEKIKQLTLFDIAGKALMQQNYDAGRNAVTLPLLLFADGMYYLQIKGDRLSGTTKVVLQRGGAH